MMENFRELTKAGLKGDRKFPPPALHNFAFLSKQRENRSNAENVKMRKRLEGELSDLEECQKLVQMGIKV